MISRVSTFLVNNKEHFSLEKGKKALDIHPEQGHNAIFLARLGFHVEALLDNKDEAQSLASFAERSGVHLKIISADPTRIHLTKEKYDLILDFYFIARGLILQIKQALKPQGIVVMESYTQKQLALSSVNSEHILKPKELLFFFKDFEVLKYQETLQSGPKAVASIIARKS